MSTSAAAEAEGDSEVVFGTVPQVDPVSDAEEDPDEAPSSEHKDTCVLVITGPTRAGKSTLAKALSAEFSCQPIKQDTYFRQDWIDERLGGNWDTPEAIDHEAMWTAIESRLKRRPRLLIIEGFMALHDPRIRDIMSLGVLVDVTKEMCRTRRKRSRFYWEEYFEKFIWPNHLRYMESIRSVPNVHTFSGEQEPATVLENVKTLLARHLE